MMRWPHAALLLALACPAAPAHAAAPPAGGLTEAALAEVALAPPPGARLPPELPLRDETGRATSFATAQGGRPAALVLADYTCTVLCGTALGLASAALRQGGEGAVLLALGIDPRDGPDDAAALKAAYVTPDAVWAHFLLAEKPALERIEALLGYRAAYDAATDSFAHPVGLVVLAPDGRVSRVLPGLEADPATLRLALVEASEGRIGSLGERVRLFCYGFDAARGIYAATVERVLTVGTVLTMLALALFLLWTWRRGRAA
jgi:protein SCO1/2